MPSTADADPADAEPADADPADDRPDGGPTEEDASSPWARVGRQWDEVGLALNGLAEEFRHRYHGAGGNVDPRLREALDRAGQAFSEAMAAIGRSIDDSQVRDQAVRSASAFGSAVASTLDALGEQVQQKVRPRGAGSGAPPDDEPTA
jgi:hypothetical protein